MNPSLVRACVVFTVDSLVHHHSLWRRDFLAGPLSNRTASYLPTHCQLFHPIAVLFTALFPATAHCLIHFTPLFAALSTALVCLM